MGNWGKFKRSKAVKQMSFSICFRSDFTFGDETHKIGRETPFLGLPVFLSRMKTE